jgi:hypothetical protein
MKLLLDQMQSFSLSSHPLPAIENNSFKDFLKVDGLPIDFANVKNQGKNSFSSHGFLGIA